MTKKPPRDPRGPKKAKGKGAKVVAFPGGEAVPPKAENPDNPLVPIKVAEKPARSTVEHQPTQVSRNLVTLACATGLNHDDIALRIGVSVNTLRKHYAEELADGGKKLLLAISGNLARIAQDPNHPKSVTAAIFWLKTRGGFRDVSLPGDNGGGGKDEKMTFTINIGGSGPKPGDDAKLVNG